MATSTRSTRRAARTVRAAPRHALPLLTAVTGGFGSSPLIAGGVVYVGSGNTLYALDAAGVVNCSGSPKTCTPLWSADTGGQVLSSPSVMNRLAYVGSGDGKLYAFDAPAANFERSRQSQEVHAGLDGRDGRNDLHPGPRNRRRRRLHQLVRQEALRLRRRGKHALLGHAEDLHTTLDGHDRRYRCVGGGREGSRLRLRRAARRSALCVRRGGKHALFRRPEDLHPTVDSQPRRLGGEASGRRRWPTASCTSALRNTCSGSTRPAQSTVRGVRGCARRSGPHPVTDSARSSRTGWCIWGVPTAISTCRLAVAKALAKQSGLTVSLRRDGRRDGHATAPQPVQASSRALSHTSRRGRMPGGEWIRGAHDDRHRTPLACVAVHNSTISLTKADSWLQAESTPPDRRLREFQAAHDPKGTASSPLRLEFGRRAVVLDHGLATPCNATIPPIVHGSFELTVYGQT